MSPLTGVLTESWQLYRAHARHLMTVALAVFLPIAIVTLLVTFVGGFFGRVLGYLVTLIGFYILEAVLVKAVQDVRDGTADMSVMPTFASAAPYLGSVAGASILAGVLIWIGFWFLLIPGIILATIWCLIVPVIVLENTGALSSFRRSQELVRGRFWNVLGTLALVVLIIIAVEIVLGLILSALPLVLAAAIGTLIAGGVVAPFGATVVTLMYFRLAAAQPGGSATVGGGPYGGQASDPYGPGFQPPGGQQDTGFPPPA